MHIDGNESEDCYSSDEEGAIVVEGIKIPPPPIPYYQLEQKGPRLVITSMENSFFKSYGAQVKLGPFHQCFNSIIGPNGSGKSNVIDSLLFVFGYKATKIRSKNISVLIHKSKVYPSITSCTVKIYFQLIIDKPNGEYEVVPDSQFYVSRTANKDNSSFYTINGQKKMFKDVALLLKTHGIDLKFNRFLILQGEVEQISLMPPKSQNGESGMLEYLEDIIGTTRYKAPLDKLVERVDEFNDRRSEKLCRMKMIQEEVEHLKEPMEEAVKFLTLENSICYKKNTKYQRDIWEIKQNSAKFYERKVVADTEAAELQAKIDKILEAQKKLQMDNDKHVHELKVFVDRKTVMETTYKKINAQHTKLQTDMKKLNNVRHKHKTALKAEEEQLPTFQEEPKTLVKDIEQLQTALNKIYPKISEGEEEAAKLREEIGAKTKPFVEEKVKLELAVTNAIKNLTEKKTALSLLENQLDLLKSASNEGSTKLQKSKEELTQCDMSIEQAIEKRDHFNATFSQKEQALTHARQDLTMVQSKAEKLGHEVRSACARVERQKSSVNTTRTNNRILNVLRQHARERNITDFYGRLGDLGAIDKKYDVAISTACGALDNFVVGSADTGQWCIELLRTQNIGRSTFIVLDKQAHLVDIYRRKLQTPENAERLFDLVRTEEKFRPAFYYALRNTLVAKDVAQASRISYGRERFRVVTLTGEMFETSGAMSGGGTGVCRGKMGQCVAESTDLTNVEAEERDIEKQKQQLEQVELKQTELVNQIANLSSEILNMKSEMQVTCASLTKLTQHKTNLIEQIKMLERKVMRASLSEVNNLEGQVARQKAVHDTAAEEVQTNQNKLDALTAQIFEHGGRDIQIVEKQLKKLKGDEAKLLEEIHTLQMKLNSNDRNKEKSEEKIQSLKALIKDIEGQLTEMNEARTALETDAEKITEVMNEINQAIDDSETTCNEIKQAKKMLEVSENAAKSEKIESDLRVARADEDLKKVEYQILGIQSKIKELVLHKIPQQEVEPFKEYTDEEMSQVEPATIIKELHNLQETVKAMTPNLSVIDEYNNKMKMLISRSSEFEEINAKWRQLRNHCDDLRTRRKNEFMIGFDTIRAKLKEMYCMITIEGCADLELIDIYDPFSEGVAFRVRPPKKTWKVISNLSGGEKTLSSLALVFALHYYKPSPLYVMDEIDAALDFKNVSIIANYIKERTKDAQFIIISLRSNMFELASYLIGIFKVYDCTRSVTIDPSEINDGKKDNNDEVTIEPSSIRHTNTMDPSSLADECTLERSSVAAERTLEPNSEAVEPTSNAVTRMEVDDEDDGLARTQATTTQSQDVINEISPDLFEGANDVEMSIASSDDK